MEGSNRRGNWGGRWGKKWGRTSQHCLDHSEDLLETSPWVFSGFPACSTVRRLRFTCLFFLPHTLTAVIMLQRNVFSRDQFWVSKTYFNNICGASIMSSRLTKALLLKHDLPFSSLIHGPNLQIRKRAEYCFESTVSEKRTH